MRNPGSSSSNGLHLDGVDGVEKAAMLNAQVKRSHKNMLRWGASFGAFSAASVNSLYCFFVLTTGHIWATDPTNVSIPEQLDRYNLLAKGSSAFSTSRNGFAIFARTMLGYYGIYILGVAGVTALANWAYRNYKIRSMSSRELEASQTNNANDSNGDISQLFEEVVINNKLVSSQKELITSALLQLLAFGFFNAVYCFTYLDVSEGATGKMPTTYGPFYTALDSKKSMGAISYALNFALDQWFAFLTVRGAFLTHKFNKLARDSFGKKSGKNTYLKPLGTGAISIVSSLPFVALSAFDKTLKTNWGSFIFYTSIPAAVVVYGLVLNYTATKEVITEVLGAYNSLTQISEWRHPKKVLNAVYQEVLEWSKELRYLLGSDDNYLRVFAAKHHFPQPAISTVNEESGLLVNGVNGVIEAPADATLTNRKNVIGKKAEELTKNERTKIKSQELEELKAALGNRIRNPQNGDGNTNTIHGYIDLYHKVLQELNEKRKSETEKADVWKYGRVRGSIRGLFGIVGPSVLSVVLFGYFFAIKNAAVAAHSPLGENDASTAMLSLALFWPFIRLVHNSGRREMVEIYDSIEKIALANKKEYIRNFDKEKAVKLTFFLTKIAVFFIAPVSSGTVISLLSDVHILKRNPGLLNSAIHTAFWGTALFNSLGVANFLGCFEEKMVDWKFYSDKKAAIQTHNKFWEGMKAGAEDLDLQPEKLKAEHEAFDVTSPPPQVF